MASIREQIMQTVKATLAATDGISGRVWRSRPDTVGSDEMPCVIIRTDSETTNEGMTGGTDARTDVLVDVYARGLEPDSLADPVVCSVHALMMADTTQGGLAIDTSEAGTNWDLESSDQQTCRVTMRFTILHRHARNNLSNPR